MEFGKGIELGGADGCEVRWMAEQHDPLALVIIRQHELAMSGFHLHVRKRIADQRESTVGSTFTHVKNPQIAIVKLVHRQFVRCSYYAILLR